MRGWPGASNPLIRPSGTFSRKGRRTLHPRPATGDPGRVFSFSAPPRAQLRELAGMTDHAIGIDFGTTNSSVVAIAGAERAGREPVAWPSSSRGRSRGLPHGAHLLERGARCHAPACCVTSRGPQAIERALSHGQGQPALRPVDQDPPRAVRLVHLDAGSTARAPDHRGAWSPPSCDHLAGTPPRTFSASRLADRRRADRSCSPGERPDDGLALERLSTRAYALAGLAGGRRSPTSRSAPPIGMPAIFSATRPCWWPTSAAARAIFQ